MRYVAMLPGSALRPVLLSVGTGFGAALAFVAGLATTDPAGFGGWAGDVARLFGLWAATGAAFTAAQFGLVLSLRAPENGARPAAAPVRVRRGR